MHYRITARSGHSTLTTVLPARLVAAEATAIHRRGWTVHVSPIAEEES